MDYSKEKKTPYGKSQIKEKGFINGNLEVWAKYKPTASPTG